MNKLTNGPCEFCPYRRDVPSGVWHPDEYDKLPPYDRPTSEQPLALFACHAVPGALCYGWAVCHNNRGHDRQLIALRIVGITPPTTSSVSLFASGQEAADHGKAKVNRPPPASKKAALKLLKKYKRLR